MAKDVNLSEILKVHFGFDTFKGDQEAIIRGAFNSLDDAINMASNVEFAGNRNVRIMVFGYFDSKLRTGVIFQSFSGNVCSQLLLLSSGMKQRNITFVDATLDVVSKKESFA